MAKLKPNSQNSWTLEYLQTHKEGLTWITAWQQRGVSALNSRISDLRRYGYPISKEMITVKNRFGEKCRVANYRLEG